MGITFKVETVPQFSVKQLAFQLTEALQGQSDFQRDAAAFRKQVKIEEVKIFELEALIEKVKDYKVNPPQKVSRMDPLATYDLTLVSNEIEEARSRIIEWKRRETEALEKVIELQQRSNELQKEIVLQNNR